MLVTGEVYSSSLFRNIGTFIAQQKSLSVVTGGVSAVRRSGVLDHQPKVLSKDKFQMECVLPALLSEVKEVHAAMDGSDCRQGV